MYEDQIIEKFNGDICVFHNGFWDRCQLSAVEHRQTGDICITDCKPNKCPIYKTYLMTKEIYKNLK